jgi:Mce-associated membrane protein
VATRVAAVVAGLGLIGSVVFGALWWTTAHGPATQVASARDDALAAARQIAVNLQTLDYRTVDKGLDNWEASATGPLLDEFKKNHKQYADQIRQVQTTTNARLVDAALSDLDVAAGKATAVAAVDVSTTQMVNGAPSLPITKQVRIKLELVRTPDDGWKADAASAIRS